MGAHAISPCLEVEPRDVMIVYPKRQLNLWVQGSQDLDAYQSDPEDGKRASGPDMLETWLLLEFCDR